MQPPRASAQWLRWRRGASGWICDGLVLGSSQQIETFSKERERGSSLAVVRRQAPGPTPPPAPLDQSLSQDGLSRPHLS